MDTLFYWTGAMFWLAACILFVWFLLATVPCAVSLTRWEIRCARIGSGVSRWDIFRKLPRVFLNNYLDPCDSRKVVGRPYYWRGIGDWQAPTERYKPMDNDGESES